MDVGGFLVLINGFSLVCGASLHEEKAAAVIRGDISSDHPLKRNPRLVPDGDRQAKLLANRTFGDWGGIIGEEWQEDYPEDVSGDVEPLMEYPASAGASQFWEAVGGRGQASSARVARDLQTVGQVRPHVPRYMLDLYQSLSRAAKNPGTGDIVRSFSNVNGDIYREYDDMVNEQGGKTRVHTLVFNVTSFPSHETLHLAELRLYALIRRDQHAYMGVERQVSVSTCHVTASGSACEPIASRHIFERSNAWETFNVNAAVQLWLGAPRNCEHRLEVRISSVFGDTDMGGDLDVDVTPYADTEPLLLLYSTDTWRANVDSRGHHTLQRRSTEAEDIEEESNNIVEDAVQLKSPSKGPPKRKHKNPCRRRSLYVNFADINYDTWIIAPPGYEAYECTGKCYFPLSDHLTPTKHAIIQTLVNTVAPKKSSRSCCVATKLTPISLLYVDDEGVVTYKFRYDDMVVAECGCR